ncbi:hypothetical protein Acr_06g0001200 [Actinidia rufa]|uniref:Uncharacterized protein n=1 Tax=Actinidia rufa TaxID=165716 RepID=A0A7J0EPF7_9ERIC|nr:hypothetical protein Acr_06g0001200 [Actinidia rufa]
MQSSKIFCILVFVIFAAQFELNAANGRLPWIVNPQDFKAGYDIIVYLMILTLLNEQLAPVTASMVIAVTATSPKCHRSVRSAAVKIDRFE